MKDPGYAALMREAIVAPEDTSEMRDGEGRLARIERDSSYPGAKCIRMIVAEGDNPLPVQWILPAATTRPAFYPTELPFLPGIACRVMEGEGRLFVSWRDPGCPVVNPEEVAALKDSMPTAMRAAAASMKKAVDESASGTPGSEVSFKDFKQHFDTEEAKEWMASMARAKETDPRFMAGFDTLLNACLEAGWEVAPQGPEDIPAVRSTSLRLGSSRRTLVLSSMMGIGSLVLTQKEEPDTDLPSDEL